MSKATIIENGQEYQVVDNSRGRFWYQNDHLCHLTGPAIQWWDGREDYWIRGMQYTKENFALEVKKLFPPPCDLCKSKSSQPDSYLCEPCEYQNWEL